MANWVKLLYKLSLILRDLVEFVIIFEMAKSLQRWIASVAVQDKFKLTRKLLDFFRA